MSEQIHGNWDERENHDWVTIEVTEETLALLQKIAEREGLEIHEVIYQIANDDLVENGALDS